MRWGKAKAGKTAVTALMALLVLAGCNSKEDERVLFDGYYFRGRAKAAGDDPAFFVATVGRVARSPEGARQAVAYEATRYCIENYGTSRIRWSIGPDTPADQLVVDKDTLSYQGECNP